MNAADFFTASELAEFADYHRAKYLYSALMLVGGPLIGIAVAWLSPRPLYRMTERWATPLRPRIPAPLCRLADRVWGSPRWLEAMIFLLLLQLLLFSIGFPARVYFGYFHEHAFGLARTSPGLFVWDTLKGTALGFGALGSLGLGLFVLARRLERWWIVLSVVSGASLLVVGYLDPFRGRVYFEQAPLEAGALRSSIEALMKTAGIDVRDIVVEKWSSHTVKMDAYFSGQGATRTVTLSDTMVASLSEREVLAVIAHEAGHVHEALWPSLAASVILLCLTLYALERLFRTAMRAAWYGASERADIRLVPLVLTLFSLGLSLVQPVSAAFSRAREARADAYAVELTRDPEALASMLVKACRVNKFDPAPPRWYVLSRASHPPILERIANLRR